MPGAPPALLGASVMQGVECVRWAGAPGPVLPWLAGAGPEGPSCGFLFLRLF